MVKRTAATRYLHERGFKPSKGTNHEHWTDGTHFTQVPRHSEISNQLFEKIKKQAALK